MPIDTSFKNHPGMSLMSHCAEAVAREGQRSRHSYRLCLADAWHDPAMSSKSGEIVVARPESPELGRYAAASVGLWCLGQRACRRGGGAAAAGPLLRPDAGDEHAGHRRRSGRHCSGLLGWGPGSRPATAASGARSAAGGVRRGGGGNPFAVRAAGAFDRGVVLMLVSTFAIIVPGTFLAAVTPMVTKLRLTTLNETGTVVGRLSAIGTAGAIVGTVVTGFVLISRLPVSGIMVGLGRCWSLPQRWSNSGYAAGGRPSLRPRW